jgi:hypothetical protein
VLYCHIHGKKLFLKKRNEQNVLCLWASAPLMFTFGPHGSSSHCDILLHLSICITLQLTKSVPPPTHKARERRGPSIVHHKVFTACSMMCNVWRVSPAIVQWCKQDITKRLPSFCGALHCTASKDLLPR